MPSTTPKQTANKPAHEIRLNGIRCTIWKNETPKGPRYNSTFERNFLDGQEWKTSESFGRDDLLTLSFVATEALRWIVEQKQPQQPTV